MSSGGDGKATFDIKLKAGTYFIASGKLSFDQVESLCTAVRVMPGENLELVYVSQDHVTESNGVCVFMTDVRVGKIERQDRWQTFLPDVRAVKVINGGLLRWDKLALTKEDGTVDTYGIYNKQHASPFLMRIKAFIKKGEESPAPPEHAFT
jgi:hypothetical protein